MFPTRSPSYFKERQPFVDTFNRQCAPFWTQYLNGEVSHEKYCVLIKPFAKQYSDNVEAIWVRFGGQPSKDRKD